MKLNNKEIEALKQHLKDKKHRNNLELELLYNKLIIDDEIVLYIDGAADLHSKTAGIGGVIYSSNITFKNPPAILPVYYQLF